VKILESGSKTLRMRLDTSMTGEARIDGIRPSVRTVQEISGTH
jgi:hypothetical protein